MGAHSTEDGRALLRAAREVHGERHGAHTLAPGTRLPFPEAAGRAGIGKNRQRYFDALRDMEYEGAIEWDGSARYARGDKHYVVTSRGLDGPDGGRNATNAGHGTRRASGAAGGTDRVGVRSRSMNRGSRSLDKRP
jgi:hypothetical protein